MWTPICAAALLAACLAATGCPRPSRQNRAELPEAAAETEPVPPAQSGPAAHLPHPEVGGWRMRGRAETYAGEGLARLVDGLVERYRAYGFEAAAAAEYRTESQPDAFLRIEVFDMGSRLGAFGFLADRIAELRDPASAESPGVTEIREAGTIGPGSLRFYRENLLVQLVLQDGSPDATEDSLDTLTREHLPRVARLLARSLPGSSDPPTELDVLPTAGRVRRGERYHPGHLLDLPELGPGVSALYGDPRPRYRVGRVLGDDEPAARAAFARLAGRVVEASAVEGLGDECSRGRLDDREVLVARRGGILAVVLADESSRAPRAATMESAARSSLGLSAEGRAGAAGQPGP